MGLTQPSKATVIFWTADLRVTASARILRHWSWQVRTRRWVAPRRVGRLDDPLLGRWALKLIENQFAMLHECAEALFERMEQ